MPIIGSWLVKRQLYLLSKILETSQWKNDLLSRRVLYRDWGMVFPCEKSGGFHTVTQGNCYVRFKNECILLEKGDLFFITKGLHHELVSSPSEIPSHDSIDTTTQLISMEMESGIGSNLIIQRLTDILFYYVIRRWIETNNTGVPGWVVAFKDEKIMATLERIHKNIFHNWTIESLAKSVGLSRASLASRFKKGLGETPIDYIAKLRLEKGKVLLENEDKTLEEVSKEVGYSSAFAFSKAFKRNYGKSPSQMKRFSKENIRYRPESDLERNSR
ncbi:MAG: helix-turn-helix transcriptional regulator [Leptospira sp.]|nr:helix-turn-helix transcriptional regulator [Leptospira sp.]